MPDRGAPAAGGGFGAAPAAPAGAGGSFAVPNITVPAPNYAGLIAQTQSPLAQMLAGFQSFQAARQQKTLFDLQTQQTQAQIRHDNAMADVSQATATGYQQQMALQNYQQFGATALQNPNLAKSPAWQTRMRSLSDAAGMPQPFDDQGNFLPDQFKTQMTAKDIALANEMHAGPTKTEFLNQFANVPKDMYSQGPDYTGKEAADIARASAMGIHYANADAVARGRLAVDQLKAQLQQETNPWKIQEIRAQIAHYQATSGQAEAAASRDIATSKLISQEVSAGLGTAKALIAQYRTNPTATGPMLAKEYTRVAGMVERARIKYDSANAAFEQAQEAGANSDPATLQKYATAKAAAEAAYQAAVGQLNQIYSSIQTEAQSPTALKAGMGAKSVTIGGKALMQLPAPPGSITDTPSINPDASGAVTPGLDQGGYPLYVNPNRLPSGTVPGVGPDGRVYYKTPDGNIYDSQGQIVQPPQQ